MSHSPEPWRVEKRGEPGDEHFAVVDASGQDVIRIASDDPSAALIGVGTLDISQTDAERIVACVNALAGQPTASLKVQP